MSPVLAGRFFTTEPPRKSERLKDLESASRLWPRLLWTSGTEQNRQGTLQGSKSACFQLRGNAWGQKQSKGPWPFTSLRKIVIYKFEWLPSMGANLPNTSLKESSPFYPFPPFLCTDHWRRLSISPCYSLELCIQMGIYFIFSFAFCFSSFHSYLSGEALQIAVKRREVKSKGEKEIYKHVNADSKE